MSNRRVLACTFALAAALAACSKSEPPAATPASTPPTAPAATPAATPAPAADSAAPVAAAAITGIAECDQFLSAYEACVTDKVPEQARAQMKVGLDQWKSSWKGLADNAATRDSLPTMCKQASEASKPALQAYGCSF